MTDNRTTTTGPPLDIRAAGTELLGERWQSPLAYLLGINPRTAQRWANGQNTIPPPLARHVVALLAVARQSRAEAADDRARRDAAPGGGGTDPAQSPFL